MEVSGRVEYIVHRLGDAGFRGLVARNAHARHGVSAHANFFPSFNDLLGELPRD